MSFEALAISIGMFILAVVPIALPQVRKYYGPVFLFGTGALVSICLFDLLPSVFELGGSRAFPLVFGAWILYSLVHLFHSHHHINENEEHQSHSPYPFFVAITIHCFSSGLLLGISNYFSAHLAHAILIALVAHKVYEAMAVSTLLVSFRRTLVWTLSLVTIYVLSFPIGYYLATVFNSLITPSLILIISGVAVGSLAGCLIFDFIIPSYSYVKASWKQGIWLLLGVLITMLT
jgi:zinc transporter ZupT